MDLTMPASVRIRQLHHQELLETAARERLLNSAVSGTTPGIVARVSSGSVAASLRSRRISRVLLLEWFARVAAITRQPLYRSSLWRYPLLGIPVPGMPMVRARCLENDRAGASPSNTERCQIA
jgi:hypothetical protein